MYLFPDWQPTREVIGGLDSELAVSPCTATALLRGRFPLLYLFLNEASKRLLARLARHSLDAAYFMRTPEYCRQTGMVAAMSMWSAAWGEALPKLGSAKSIRATYWSDAESSCDLGCDVRCWEVVHKAHRTSLMQLLPYPEELELTALAMLPDGDGVGPDAEQVFGPENLAAGFFLSTKRDFLLPYPALDDYIERQVRRLSFLNAQNFVVPWLGNLVARFARTTATIAAASVWHSVWSGLERPVASKSFRPIPALFFPRAKSPKP